MLSVPAERAVIDHVADEKSELKLIDREQNLLYFQHSQYINRLIAFTSMPLQPTNWRPLILCSLLVAQKVWDDRYLSNDDFAYIYPFFVTKEINKLEQKFLELIQYNVTVKASLYAKYYFELRSLFKDSQKEFPLKPLDDKDSKRLEIRSEKYQDAFVEATEAKKRDIKTIADIKYVSKEE